MQTDSEILRRYQRRPAFRVVPSSDWRAIIRKRTNVLVIGPKAAQAAFLRLAQSEMREPIKSVGDALPSIPDGVQTLVLTEVDALDRAQQKKLATWLSEREAQDVQIISLATTPLFSLVEAKRFDAQLYYRLNTILLEIQAA